VNVMSKRRPPQPEDPPDEQDARPDATGDEAADEGSVAAERDDLLARLQRLSADYLNYQKRQQREIAEARGFANAELAKDLLAVLDDMERGMAAAEANHDADDPLLAGMHLVYDKALEALARHGVSPIAAAEGEPFDPLRHEAMMQQPTGGDAGPTVARELQRGYEIRGRVLRPARVIVAVPAGGDDGPDEDGEEDE